MPSLSTQTQTLSHRKFSMIDDPSGTIIASTRGFSLSIVATAHFPSTPRSSGHELLPACTQVKYCLSKQTYMDTLNYCLISARKNIHYLDK